MKNEWINVRINKIALAMYVPPNTGKIVHRNRPFHGFIFNSETVSRDYCFSDGTVLKTKGNDLFYLPKGSTYVVKDRASGGCYAINFDADISDTPFSVNLKNCDIIKKLFKRAAEEWDGLGVKQSAFAMSALYEAICALHKESERSYIPSEKHKLIEPAVEMINKDFLNSDLSVETLAHLCGISAVYLRKIFLTVYGTSPKEYIIRKRMDYACRLLSSGQFEVQSVAEICGYSEPCHFSREFKRRMGVAPKDYV